MNILIKKFGLSLQFLLVASIAATTVSAESTSLWDVIPITSQLKSLFQIAVGDMNGAEKTWVNFLNEGLGTSQTRSVYFLVTGEPGKALDVQKKFFSNLECLVDGTPVVGHVKGAVHLLTGDHDRGMNAIKSATSTTGTVLGGAALGPAGAVVGRVLTDSLITAADYAFNESGFSPHGVFDYMEHFREKDAGEHFDQIAGLAFDGWAGGKAKATRSSFNKPSGQTQVSNDPGVELVRGVSFYGSMDSGSYRSAGSVDSLQTIFSKEKYTQEKNTPNVAVRSDTPSDPQLRIDEEFLSNFQNYYRTSIVYHTENTIKSDNFYNYLDIDPTYAAYGLKKLPRSALKKRSFEGLSSYVEDPVLDTLSLDAVKKNLNYLSDSEKSLISKNDFRSVNTDIDNMVNVDSVLSSLAGVVGEDVKTLTTRLSKTPKQPYIENLDRPPVTHFDELAKRRNIEYTVSNDIKGLSKLNDFITENTDFIHQRKHLILTETSATGAVDSYVLKIKKLEGHPNHAKLLIDYNMPGLLDMGVPNPFRVTTFLKSPDSTFKVYAVDVLDKALTN